MRRTIVIAAFFCLAAAATAAELDRAAAAIAGREASFVQRFTPKGFRSSQVESGSVIFGSLPMMRWSYVKPEEKLFVFDGSKSWFYVPADRQVTIAPIDERRRRELPFLLVGDPGARNRHFSVSERQRSRKWTTTLQPRDRAAMIRSVTITTDASSHLIESIEYADRDGNRTVFSFSGYKTANVSGDTFRFTPPAGVQITNAE